MISVSEGGTWLRFSTAAPVPRSAVKNPRYGITRDKMIKFTGQQSGG